MFPHPKLLILAALAAVLEATHALAHIIDSKFDKQSEEHCFYVLLREKNTVKQLFTVHIICISYCS